MTNAQLPVAFSADVCQFRKNLFRESVKSAALLAACLGEGVACWAAARARDLIELVTLRIGGPTGLIQPGIFAVMVLMAIGTLLMAKPVFERVCGRHATRTRCGS